MAPWTDGLAVDFRAYGDSCPEHAGAVIALAELRLSRSTLIPGESIGEVAAYPRADAPAVPLRPD